ncbi:MAG: PLP-dependent transferase [Planctomycetes bacterium]|nr:PLP-dependent transferase [Planctomycetota bacterium]
MTQYSTLAIHAGPGPDEATGALLTPIHQSTTFKQDGIGQDRGFTYSRTGNPTVSALEERLGALENALPATAYATGMAATTTLFLSVLRAGDRVVVSDVVYGGTVRVLQQVLHSFGVEAEFVDTADLNQLADALRKPTRLVFLETPANPTLKLTDIEGAAKLAKAAGALVAVDNTFLTSALQQPLDLGADVVVYSTTKYIEGHNSTVGGALLTRDEELNERIRFVKGTAGTTQAPWESWLTLRGLKTLPLRLEKHSQNALHVAQYLEKHAQVAQVYYPYLPSFPQYELAQRQQSSGGGIVSFELNGGLEAGKQFLSGLKLFTLAENLGAVESLVTHPATMTHASVPVEQRRAAGIRDGLIRLSVGLEGEEDLIADLDWALKCVLGGVLS